MKNQIDWRNEMFIWLCDENKINYDGNYYICLSLNLYVNLILHLHNVYT
jgi:hypothetical protein